MVSRNGLNLLIAGGALAVVLACTAQTPACGLLDRLFGGSACPAPTYQAAYAPDGSPCAACPSPCPTYSVGFAPSCPPSSPVTTVGYRPVPTTRYRFRLVREPVTTYRPVVTADPCTGCQTTAYQPVTRTRLRFRWVPHTSYRYQPVSLAAPTMTGFSPSGCCPPCDPCASPSVGGACPGGACGPATTYNGGAGATAPGSPAPRTFQESQSPVEQRELKPVPESEDDTEAQSSEPRLILPENNTTTRPVSQSGDIRLVSRGSAARPAPALPAPLEYNGWRPASD